MRKGILTIVLIIVLLASTVACGSQTAPPPTGGGGNTPAASPSASASSAPPSSAPASPPPASPGTAPPASSAPGGVGIGDWLFFEGPLNIKHVGFSIESLQTEFAAGLANAIISEIESRGWTYELNEADTDAMKQIAQCEDMIAKGIDALILKPIDESSFAPISQLCLEEGIPLIIPNTYLNSLYTIGAMADQYNNGIITATLLMENNPGTLKKVFVLRGPLVSESFNIRTQGAMDTFAAGGYEVVFEAPTDAPAQPHGLAATENFLSAGIEFDSIWAANDSLAIGAAIAVAEAGLADQVYIFGNGGQREAAENILRGGQLDGTIYLTPDVYVAAAFEAFDKLVAGQPYEQKNMVQVKGMFANNVRDFYPDLG
ncbi:MAG: sugar ABC transporter substrate-binding protein [Synergistaceae bacterium]|nr:sugar ABC transporter substrate-binding protein [Synergistaceae bacterium]